MGAPAGEGRWLTLAVARWLLHMADESVMGFFGFGKDRTHTEHTAGTWPAVSTWLMGHWLYAVLYLRLTYTPYTLMATAAG